MAQVSTSRATWHQVVAPPAFREGFEDAWAGRPFRYDLDAPPGGGLASNRVWAYERGRAFAIWCKAENRDPRPLKRGNRITWQAMDAVQDAVRARAVI